MKNIVVGIIGLGRIGKIHIKNIKRFIPQMVVKIVVDPYIDESWTKIQDIPVTKEYKTVLADPEIEAVLICTPSYLHVPIIIEAAKAGKHIFCEKPLALDVHLIKQAIAVVETSGVKLQVGFNRRFDPSFVKVRDTIQHKQIGEAYLLRITSRDPVPPSEEYIKHSGGLFLDMTIHDFDMARFLIGSEIVEVCAMGVVRISPIFTKLEDIDTAVVQLKFADGTLGIIDNSRQAVYGYDQRVEVFGSRGSIAAENSTPTRTILSTESGILSEKPYYFFLERYERSFIEEMKTFCDCVLENRASPVTGYDGLVSVVVGLAAMQSIKEKRVVLIDLNK